MRILVYKYKKFGPRRRHRKSKRKWKNISTPFVIGHRCGNDINTPENTLIGINRGKIYNLPAIEIDVKQSATVGVDGLVLMHDETVDATTEGSGAVNSFTVEQLKTLDAGSYIDSSFSSERIPTLREVFEKFGNEILYYIDGLGTVADVIGKLILQSGLSDYCIAYFQTYQAIDLFRTVNQITPTAIGYGSGSSLSTAINDCLSHNVQYMYIDYLNAGLTSSFVTSAHNANLKIIAGVLNNKSDKNTVIAKGVDGVMARNGIYMGDCITPQPMTLPYTFDLNSSLYPEGWVETVTYVGKPAFVTPGGGGITKPVAAGSTFRWITYGLHSLPENGSYKINFTLTPTELMADTLRYFGIFLVEGDKMSSTWAQFSGYGAMIRQQGNMTLTKSVAGVGVGDLAYTSGTGNLQVGTPIPCELTITPTTLTFKRLDNNKTVTANDNAHRSNLHFCGYWSDLAGTISNISVTDV